MNYASLISGSVGERLPTDCQVKPLTHGGGPQSLRVYSQVRNKYKLSMKQRFREIEKKTHCQTKKIEKKGHKE